MPHAVLSDAIPVLHVQDVDAAISYYVEKLGFEVDFRYDKDPGSYAGVKRGQVRLHVHRQTSGDQGNGAFNRVRIFVDNPDALLDEFRSRGAIDGSTQARDTEWDTREFSFHDPDGNELAFFRMR